MMREAFGDDYIDLAVGRTVALRAQAREGEGPSAQSVAGMPRPEEATMTGEHARTVTMKGKALALAGRGPEVGDQAPDFAGLNGELNVVRLSDFAGKVVLISAAVSVDTGVCAVQTRRFNEELESLPEDVVVLAVSMDLPFALGRFCGAEGLDRIRALSDHRDAQFGPAYGVLIEDMRLLARAIFVVDRQGRIAYKEIVPEVTDHPDYDAALAAVREAATR